MDAGTPGLPGHVSVTRRARFREADVKRAVSGAKRSGLAIARVEIEPDGTIAIIVGQPDVADEQSAAWDARIKEQRERIDGTARRNFPRRQNGK